MIRIFTRQIEKLGSEEGQALVFVAMVGLVIFLFFAMSMNLAELVNTKIKSQNAVDAAALSGAVWQARAFNLVAGTNENLLNLWANFLTHVLGEIVLLGLCNTACGAGFSLACGLCVVLMALNFVSIFVLFGIGQDTGVLQSQILDAFDRELLEHDLGAGAEQNILDLNYAFKENTASDEKASFYYARDVDGNLIEGIFEKVTWCELVVGVLYYLSWQIWMERDPPDYATMEAQWASLRPIIANTYARGSCTEAFDLLLMLERLLPGFNFRALFPYVLKTKIAHPTNPGAFIGQDLEPMLPITVGTYKEQEAPVLLGKGTLPPECVPGATDSQFPCPDARHYSFASAHAFSESVSYFYNVAVAGISAPGYPIPLVPFKSDWEARLFPIEPDPGGVGSPYGGWTAYEDIVDQMEAEAGGAYEFVVNHILWANGRRLFLY